MCVHYTLIQHSPIAEQEKKEGRGEGGDFSVGYTEKQNLTSLLPSVQYYVMTHYLNRVFFLLTSCCCNFPVQLTALQFHIQVYRIFAYFPFLYQNKAEKARVEDINN